MINYAEVLIAIIAELRAERAELIQDLEKSHKDADRRYEYWQEAETKVKELEAQLARHNGNSIRLREND